MVKFADVISVKRSSCTKCFTLQYSLPCKVDDDIVKYLDDLGKPLYSVKSSRLLRIDILDDYKIEAKIGKNIIKLAVPRVLDGTDLKNNEIKNKFESALCSWISNKLDIEILI